MAPLRLPLLIAKRFPIMIDLSDEVRFAFEWEVVAKLKTDLLD